jgi:hypothetical protein
LEVIERYADGVASEEEVTEIQFALMPSVGRRSSQAFIAAVPPVWGFMGSILQGTVTAITLLTNQIANRISERENDTHAALRSPPGEEIQAARAASSAAELARSRERAAQSSLLRDIFGNPFRPRRRIQPQWLSWNTGIIAKLAQAIYNKRAFDRMPILAAALEKAGCTDQDILGHCRSGGEHCRGCWVVDLVLGKE